MNIPKNEIRAHTLVERGELEIDEQGRVWRIHERRYNRWSGEIMVRPCNRKRADHREWNGYRRVKVKENKITTRAAAHRLVWHHFFGEIPDGLTVNHKNGVRDDNRPQNLELATMSQQALHAAHVLKTARCVNQLGEKHPCSKFTAIDVIEIRRLLGKGAVTQKELAERFGVCPQTISNVRHRKRWAHIP